jgi:hypothetical protein
MNETLNPLEGEFDPGIQEGTLAYDSIVVDFNKKEGLIVGLMDGDNVVLRWTGLDPRKTYFFTNLQGEADISPV